MTRQITWRCEACGARLSAIGLVEIGRLDRIHAASCPGIDAAELLAESQRRHPSSGDVVDVDTGGRL